MELQKTDSYAKAYVEILEIINSMGKEYKKKIPDKLLNFFEKNKDSDYSFQLNEFNFFSEKTIGLLAMIELKYWAENNEKELLNKALDENERKYQKELREKYNPDNLFKNKIKMPVQEDKPVENNFAVVPVKENFFTKFIKKIKAIFHIN